MKTNMDVEISPGGNLFYIVLLDKYNVKEHNGFEIDQILSLCDDFGFCPVLTTRKHWKYITIETF